MKKYQKGFIVPLLAFIVVIALGGVAYYSLKNKNPQQQNQIQTNPSNTPVTPVSDEQAIKDLATQVLNAGRSVTTFADVKNIISTYYSTQAIQTFQMYLDVVSKNPSSLSAAQDILISIQKGMPDPATVTFISTDISGNMATTTMALPGVTYGTMNGKPVGNPMTSTLSLILVKENGQWKVASTKEVTKGASAK